MKERIKDPRERFTKLAEQRTSVVLDKLRILGNLSNRQNYRYDDNDVQKIFGAIEEQLRAVRAKFKNTKKKEFKL